MPQFSEAMLIRGANDNQGWMLLHQRLCRVDSGPGFTCTCCHDVEPVVTIGDPSFDGFFLIIAQFDSSTLGSCCFLLNNFHDILVGDFCVFVGFEERIGIVPK